MNRLAVGLVTLMSVAMTGNAHAADKEKGKAVFDLWCTGCHQPFETPGGWREPERQGMRAPAGTYTQWERYKGTIPAALEERTGMTPDFIKTVVRQGVNIMTPMRKTEITDEDLDDLVAYLSKDEK